MRVPAVGHYRRRTVGTHPPEALMTAREPAEMAQVAAETGAKKTHRSWDRVLVSAFLAGAYISFGALVAITVSSGLDPSTWGTLPTLFMGAAFTLGLVLVLIAGSEGNALLTFERLITVAEGKTDHTAWETFLRGVGCNWLVCLAV